MLQFLLFTFISCAVSHLPGTWEDEDGHILSIALTDNIVSGSYEGYDIVGFAVSWAGTNNISFLIKSENDLMWSGVYQMSEHDQLVANVIIDDEPVEIVYSRIKSDTSDSSSSIIDGILFVSLTVFMASII